MQDQMRPQDKNDATSSPKNSGDNQAAEQPPAAENSCEPTPNDDMPNEPNEDPSAETQNTNTQDGQSKDPKNGAGQKDGRDPGSNADKSQTG